MERRLEPLLEMQASHIGVLVEIPLALPPVQLPASAPGKTAENDQRAWVLATHMGDTGGVLASGFSQGQPSLLEIFEE